MFTVSQSLSLETLLSGKRYKRHFNSTWYTKKEWMCGCEDTSALFCFPCLIFEGDSSWSLNGVTNLAQLSSKASKHEKSQKHLDNVLSFSLLGKNSISTYLSEAYKNKIKAHNENVTKNLKILGLIVQNVLLCAKNESPLRGHEESLDADNPGVFINNLLAFALIDDDLKRHLESNSLFKGYSKTIQNEVLELALEFYQNVVVEEVKRTDYVCVCLLVQKRSN